MKFADRDLEEDDLKAVPRRQVVVRVLYNLMTAARQGAGHRGAVAAHVDAADRHQPRLGRGRGMRAVLRLTRPPTTPGQLEGRRLAAGEEARGVDLRSGAHR